jgi:hypothetical protein
MKKMAKNTEPVGNSNDEFTWESLPLLQQEKISWNGSLPRS